MFDYTKLIITFRHQILCALTISMVAQSAVLNTALISLSSKDTLCTVWITFADKGPTLAKSRVSPRALLRRKNALFSEYSIADAAISQSAIGYIEQKYRTRCRARFKWENQASFTIHTTDLNALTRENSIKAISPVGQFKKQPAFNKPQGVPKNRATVSSEFGCSYAQLNVAGIADVHDYLKGSADSIPGTGVLMAFFDAGFVLDHPCFTYAKDNGALVADSDFVGNTGNVAVLDPEGYSHGAETMSLVGGYDPGLFTGAAYGIHFVLARTENDLSEHYVEEDYWAAAVVWAESLGVDIVSSSLGYRYDFNPPDTDHTFAEMDGATTVVSRAAAMAAERGMIIVNSVGNEGYYGAGSVNAPADVEAVVSVGGYNYSGSSRGPTADGRTKPDCAVMAENVYRPNTSVGVNYWNYGNGTSFAAPVVAGVCALIHQCHPDISEAELKDRLYGSCRFAPGQIVRDNTFGWGIPDAMLAILDSNQVFVRVVDSSGNSLEGIVIKDAQGTPLGTTNSRGVAVIVCVSAPTQIIVSDQLLGDQYIAIDALHVKKVVDLAPPVQTLRVYPNIISRQSILNKKGVIIFESVINLTTSITDKMVLSVRGVDGRQIWSGSGDYTEHNGRNYSHVEWNCRSLSGKIVAGGVYYAIAQINGKRYSQKFFVLR